MCDTCLPLHSGFRLRSSYRTCFNCSLVHQGAMCPSFTSTWSAIVSSRSKYGFGPSLPHVPTRHDRSHHPYSAYDPGATPIQKPGNQKHTTATAHCTPPARCPTEPPPIRPGQTTGVPKYKGLTINWRNIQLQKCTGVVHIQKDRKNQCKWQVLGKTDDFVLAIVLGVLWNLFCTTSNGR